MADESLRQDIVLSVQGGLLGNVTPNLRGVAADWQDKEIHITCYYHGDVSNEDREIMSVVHTEVATDFLDTMAVHFSLERLDHPSRMNEHRAWIYLRREQLSP